jgi:Ca2+-transporting ATPase
MNLFLLLAVVLVLTLFIGRLLEKFYIPWVFTGLFLGIILSLNNPFEVITSSPTFSFLADLGMYFLLFLIGLELDVKEIFKQGKFIFNLSISLVLAETFFGSIFLNTVFGIPWGIAILTASSFATVGEAILIPILDEFNLTKTNFGQILLGVGTLDDITELITLLIASFVFGYSVGESHISLFSNLMILGFLFLIPLFLQIFHSKIHHFKFQNIPSLFLFGLVILFIFVGVGDLVESAALGAIFAGIGLKNLLSQDKIKHFEDTVKAIAYGFLVPLFFLKIGTEVDIRYLLSAPILVLSILLITSLTKIGTSYFIAKTKLGVKKSILLGIGLSAKFSTSIVILTMLYDKGIVPVNLYSVLIGAMIISKFIIPVSFSVLLKKWGMVRNSDKS